MGQMEIYELMRKNPRKWWSRWMLSEVFGVGYTSIGTTVNKLKKIHEFQTKLVLTHKRVSRKAAIPRMTEFFRIKDDETWK